jgi:MFS family permease
MSTEVKEEKKIGWSIILIFALWFASWNVLWGIYNNYLPIFFQAGGENFDVQGASTALGFGIGAFAVGLLMSADNVAGALFKLFFGPIADRVKSRKKIVLISGVIAAIAYAMIPFGLMRITPEQSGDLSVLTGPFIYTVAILCIMIAAWGVAEITESSLLHVIVPSEQRAKVVGYRVFIGGLAFVATLMLSNMLYSIHIGMPFWIGSGLYAITLILYAWKIVEPEGSTLAGEVKEKTESFMQQVKEAIAKFSREEKRALLIVALTKFFMIFGIMAFQTYGSSYIVDELGINEAAAGNYLAVFFSGYMIAALPAGYLANKIGRKNLLVIALGLYTLAGLVQYFSGVAATLIPALVVIGISTSVSDIIPLSMAADTVPTKKVMGMTMGFFFFVATTSAIVAVPLFGWIFEITGNNFNLMWLGVAVSGIIGLLIITRKKDNIGEVTVAIEGE